MYEFRWNAWNLDHIGKHGVTPAEAEAMSRRKSYYERFMQLSDEQRDAEVARFDKELVGVSGKPVTAAQRAQHRRARRKSARLRTGNGTARILINIERGLLERADAYAKAHRTSRSVLVAKGLKAVIDEG